MDEARQQRGQGERRADRDRSGRRAVRARHLFDQVRDILLVVRPDGAIVDANGAAERAYGYTREDLVERTIADIRDPATLPDLPGDLKRALDDGAFFSTRHRRRDGSTFPVEVNSSVASVHGDRLILSVIRDVSEREAAANALHEREERLRLAAEVAGLGTWRIDVEAGVVHLDDRMGRMWGEPGAASLQAVDVFARIHPDDRDRVAATLATASEPGSDGHYAIEFRILLPAGDERTFAANGLFRFAPDGEARDAIGAALDLTERRRALDDLRLRASLLDHAWDAIHAWTWDGAVVYWNRGAERLYGIPEANALGRNCHDLLRTEHPQGWPAFLGALARAGAREDELVQYDAAGQRLVVETRHQLVEQDGRRLVLAASRDVTGRVEAEARARTLAERFAAAETGSGGFIYDADIATGRMWRSAAFERITGYEPTPENATRAWWFSLVHPDDADPRFAPGTPPEPTEDFYDDEYRLRHRDGGWIWIWDRGAVVRDDAGRAARLVGSAVDITARKAGEEALRASESRLRQLADAMPQIVWVSTADGATIEYLNRRWTEYTGLATTSDPDTSQPIHPDDRERVAARWAEALAAGIPFEDELRMRGADGEHRWFLSRCVPVRDESGAVVRWFGTSTDIEEVHQLAAERDTFLAAVAHDMKTPLTAVRGQAQLLQRRLQRHGTIDPEQIDRALNAIIEAGDRAAALIDEMVDTARLGAGTSLELRPEPTDLVALARTAAADGQRTTERHQIAVETPHAELVAMADGSRLGRVLGNLLENAIKYSPDGGRIEIRVEREDGPVALIAVEDQGMGIPAGDIERIFERFRRGGNVAGRISGAGIGLSGARQIAEAHGGSLTARSVEGQGSTFLLRLPLSAPTPVGGA